MERRITAAPRTSLLMQISTGRARPLHRDGREAGKASGRRNASAGPTSAVLVALMCVGAASVISGADHSQGRRARGASGTEARGPRLRASLTGYTRGVPVSFELGGIAAVLAFRRAEFQDMAVYGGSARCRCPRGPGPPLGGALDPYDRGCTDAVSERVPPSRGACAPVPSTASITRIGPGAPGQWPMRVGMCGRWSPSGGLRSSRLVGRPEGIEPTRKVARGSVWSHTWAYGGNGSTAAGARSRSGVAGRGRVRWRLGGPPACRR
jgi:hypothetical protein